MSQSSRAADTKSRTGGLTRFFVSQSPGGGWLIFREGQTNPSHKLPRRVIALETARTMARFAAPSQVMVEQQDGSYLLQYEFGPGSAV